MVMFNSYVSLPEGTINLSCWSLSNELGWGGTTLYPYSSHHVHIKKVNFKSSSGWWLTYPSEKYESQLGWLFPIDGKTKHVPNHQPVLNRCSSPKNLVAFDLPNVIQCQQSHFWSQQFLEGTPTQNKCPTFNCCQIVESPLAKSLPSGNLTVCYWKWPFIVDFPIKNGDFP